MIITKIVVILFVSLGLDKAQALVEIDAKYQMRLDNHLNKVYFMGHNDLQILAATNQNETAKNITEDDLNDIE